MGGPPPSRVPPPFDPPIPPGVAALDVQRAIFEQLRDDARRRGEPLTNTQAGPPARQTMNEFLRAIPEAQREGMRFQFLSFAGGEGAVADFDSADQFTRFQNSRGFGEALGGGGGGGGGGAVGRTQFESERLVDEANARLLQERALTESFVRELQRQQAGTEAQNRVQSQLELLQVTDQLADARRKAAVEALLAAAPFMVNPGPQFTPGFEPGGPGQQLGSLLGANVPNQMLPTATLPLNELANPPLAAPPSLIAEQLNPGLTAPGTPQIPF